MEKDMDLLLSFWNQQKSPQEEEDEENCWIGYVTMHFITNKKYSRKKYIQS